MRMAQILAAFLLAMQLISPAQAQVEQAPAPQEQRQMQVPPTKMAGDKTAEGDDKLIIIQGPKLGPARKAEPSPEQMEGFYRAIWDKVGQTYVDPTKINDWAAWEHKFDGKIKSLADLDKALKEMVTHVGDRWTTYTSTADIDAMREQAKAGLLPVGAMLRRDAAGQWRIDAMIYGTSAQESVLREGDAVKAISVNGQPAVEIAKLSDVEVMKLLSGKLGDKITVIATWDGADHPVELTVGPMPADQVEVGLLPGKIGYIRLPTFMSEEIVGQFIQALGQLYAASEGELSGLVFDLRYNTGGRVDLALAISSLFVERGIITRTTTRENRSITETNHKVIPMPKYMEERMPAQAAEFQRTLLSVPMVILVNGSTASASEITTGALVDNGRAVVIGTHTFGKAVGYQRGRIENGGILQITTLFYLTPNGNDIGGKGITPDKVVPQPRGAEEDEQLKAAHAYLIDIVKQRAKALADARDRATSPQDAQPVAPGAGFHVHGVHVALGLMGSAMLAMLIAFAVSQRRKSRR